MENLKGGGTVRGILNSLNLKAKSKGGGHWHIHNDRSQGYIKVHNGKKGGGGRGILILTAIMGHIKILKKGGDG